MPKPQDQAEINAARVALKASSNKMSAALLRADTSLRRIARERERRSRQKTKQQTQT